MFEYEQEQLLFGREIIADPKRIALWWMPEGLKDPVKSKKLNKRSVRLREEIPGNLPHVICHHLRKRDSMS